MKIWQHRKKIGKVNKRISDMSTDINAKQFVERLKALRSPEELKKIQRYFKSGEGEYGEDRKSVV